MQIEFTKTELISLFRSVRKLTGSIGRVGLAEPDDIAQDAMIKVLRSRNVQRRSSGWVHKVVRSSVVDAYRRMQRDARLLLRKEELVVCEMPKKIQYGTSPAGHTQDSEQPFRLPAQFNCLSRLTPPLLTVLLLDAQGKTYKEMASITGVKIGTVRSRLYHARRQARKIISECSPIVQGTETHAKELKGGLR